MPDINITAIVRSSEHLDSIAATGTTPVQGDFSEHAKISDLAEKADIVVNAADSDDVALNEALLAGLKRRKDNGKGKGVLIHVSGGAVFTTKGDGSKVEGGKIWDVCTHLFFSEASY